MEPVPVFIHIPKTAGTAFRKILESNIPADDRIEIYRIDSTTLEDYVPKIRRRVDHAQVILGHFEARIDQLIARECAYFTIFREPVERVLSLYKFIKYDFPEHGLHKHLKSGALSLDSWIDHTPPMMINVMTKMISGMSHEYGLSSPDMLAPAISRMHSMPAFGIQERYNDSIDLICAAFDWTPQYQEDNRSSMNNEEFIAHERISLETIDKIKALNSLDLELYKAAQEAFDIRLHELRRHKPAVSLFSRLSRLTRLGR